MATVKVMKNGNCEFIDSIRTIGNKFKLLLKRKKEIDLMLSSEEWTRQSTQFTRDRDLLIEYYEVLNPEDKISKYERI